jgi:hypothetical protein
MATAQGAANAKGKRRKDLVEEWAPTPKKLYSAPKSKAAATPHSGASKSAGELM